jgi:tetratricopeptide (TPR) repeat protein
MADLTDQIEELLSRAEEFDDGLTKIAIIEEAVNLAETHQNLDEAFRARCELVRAAIMGGRPDLAIVAYTWVLARSDEDPERFHDPHLLWRFKWIIDKAPHFPSITRQQIEDLLEDMTRRYQADGSTLHAVLSNRRSIATMMGDLDKAREYHAVLLKTERDHLSDCHACVQDEEVWHHSEAEEDEQALEAAEPILKGKLSCSSVPQCTYARVLLPLARLGRWAEAEKHHKKGYRLIAWNPAYLTSHGSHMQYLALAGDRDRALTLLQRHLPMALAATSPRWQYLFYSNMAFTLERFELTGYRELPFRLPDPLKHLGGEKTTLVEVLLGWIRQQLQELADAFDRRNGNDYHTRKVADLSRLHQYARHQ